MLLNESRVARSQTPTQNTNWKFFNNDSSLFKANSDNKFVFKILEFERKTFMKIPFWK